MLPGAAPAGRFRVLVEGGYKSDGFVRGERPHGEPILRAGIVIRCPPD